MTSETSIENARCILPGHGFFGFQAPFRLRVPVGAEVDCIRISIESDALEFLNLGAIVLYSGECNVLDLSEHIASAKLSTAYRYDMAVEIVEVLEKGQPIHSGHERLPSLTLQFRESIYLGAIEIANRPGICGVRSRDLVVRAWRGNDDILHYRNGSDAALLTRHAWFMQRIGTTGLVPQPSNIDTEASALELRERIASGLRSGSLQWTIEELLWLLPAYDPNPGMDECTLMVLAHLVASRILRDGSMQTVHMRDFERILCSHERIEALRECVTELVQKQDRSAREIVFAKHTLGFAELLGRESEYLSAMHWVQRQLREWEVQSMICYGTLLGAVRDGNFLSHDDDVDLLYCDASRSREEMDINRESLLQRFKETGCKVWNSGSNFHVVPPDHAVSVDVFPSWIDEEGTWLMMERGVYRPVPTTILLPNAPTDLLGETYAAPADPYAFLTERYGENWKVADPYHEWPWVVAQSSA